MARFLFAAWPFPGHVHPQMSMALALRSRGHEVTFYTGSRMLPLLTSEGLSGFAFRHVPEGRVLGIASETERVDSRTRDLRAARRRSRLVFQTWLVGTIPDQVADLQEIIRSWRPDVIAADPVMWGPPLVLREMAHLPVAVASFLLGCPVDGPQAPPWGLGLPPPRTKVTRALSTLVGACVRFLSRDVRRQLNTIRAQYHLPPLAGSVNAFLGRLPLHVIPSVASLDYNRRDLPASVHYVGPCVWNKPSHEPPPPWLAQLGKERPLVHVTEGTAHEQDAFVLRAAAQGLAERPVDVVMTSGRHRDPLALDLGCLAANVRVEQWVSHTDILPRCSALVTTGGAGTVLAALQVGVPMIVVPTHSDKSENAQRVAEAGAGIRLAPRQCTPDRLRAAVERVLTEPSYGANARRLAGELATAPGPEGAALLLERLAARSESA